MVRWRQGSHAASLALLGVGALIAAATEFRVPRPSRQLPAPVATSDLSRSSINRILTLDDEGCAGVTSTVWHPLSGIEYTGRLRITLPAQPGGAIVLYVGDAVPLDIEASTVTGAPVPLHHERLLLGPGVMVPPDFWLEDGSPTLAPQHLSRLQIDAAGDERRVVSVSLGRRAARVLTQLIGYPPSVRVPVCAQALAAGEQYFGAGWFGAERDAVEGPVRWMRAHGAVMVAVERSIAQVGVRLAPAVLRDGIERPELILRVNDVWSAPPVALASGFHDYVWAVPDTAWVAGTNELFFSVSRTRTAGSRQLGLALASLHVR